MSRITKEQVDAMPRIPCECGCGTLIPPYSVKRQIPRRFATGHYARVHKIPHTVSGRQKQGEAKRANFLAQFSDKMRQCKNCTESYELSKFFIRNKKRYVAVCVYCRRSADAAVKRAARALDPFAHRIKVAMKAYAITEEHAVQLLNQLRCAICGEAASAIDHNHLTGRVRERLCSKCNRALGLLDEDIARFQAAIAYLIKHNEIQGLEAALSSTTTLV